MLLFFKCTAEHPNQHSFPTRRSSDLQNGIIRRRCLVDDHNVAADDRRIEIGAELVATQRVEGYHAGSGVNSREKSIARGDRKSTRLNSSHITISYAVFCLKKKKIKYI